MAIIIICNQTTYLHASSSRSLIPTSDDLDFNACKGWRNSSLALEKVVATSHVAIPEANQGKLMKAPKGKLVSCGQSPFWKLFCLRLLSFQFGLHTPHSSVLALSFCQPWMNKQITDSWMDCRSKLMQTSGTWFPTFAKTHRLPLQCEYISWTSWWKQCRKYLLQGKEGLWTCPQTQFSRKHTLQTTILNSSKNPLLISYPSETLGIVWIIPNYINQ